jgi:ribulose-bisphosphate carboxylase large chain
MTPRRRPAAPRARILVARGFRWSGVAVERYRDLAGASAPRAVRQVLLAGSRGAPTTFDVRYFELAPGGRTNFEQHRHAHVVIGLRGSGRVRLGRGWRRVKRFDVCYVAPNTPHELHNDRRGAFGFLCIVDAERDRGRSAKLAASPRRPTGQRIE